MYLYDGEFNVPMNAAAIETHEPEIKDGRMMIMERIEEDDPFLGPHNPTVYGSRAEMKAVENEEIPFDDPPKRCCSTCWEYDGDRCHKEWNNNDDCYYIPWRDDKEPEDVCDDWEYCGEGDECT